MASEKTVQPETLRYSADAGNAELSALCGPLDENLRQIETILNVRVSRRGDVFRVTGELEAAQPWVYRNCQRTQSLCVSQYFSRFRIRGIGKYPEHF